MKHYAKFKGGDEYDLINPRCRRYVCHSEEWLAQTKKKYRRRERRILKRMTAELVDEEVFYDLEAERDYALSCYEQAMNELHEVELSIRDAGVWNEELTRLFALSYSDVRRRFHEAQEAA